MADIVGKNNELQIEEVDGKSPDNEITRIRIIEKMNFLDRESYHLGDIVESGLSYDDFRLEMDKTWTLFQGQSIIGSDLSQELSINNLGDLVSNDGMLIQSVDQSDLCFFRSGRNNYHRHGLTRGSDVTANYTLAFEATTNLGTTTTASESMDDSTDEFPDAFYDGSSLYNRESQNGNPESAYVNSGTTGPNFKPKSYKVNIFIKVNESREWNDV